MERIIASFEDHFVIVTASGSVRAGIKGLLSKEYPATCDNHAALIEGAESATCDDDLENLFFTLGV